MTKLRATLTLAVLAAALVVVPAANATRVFAIPGSLPRNVVSFHVNDTATFLTTVPLAGALADPSNAIIGIDVNPKDGATYVMYRLPDDSAQIVTLDPYTGATGFPVQLKADPADASAPYTGYTLDDGDIDFDPVSGLLRVVNRFGVNLRVAVATGNVTTDPAVVETGGIAYSSNFAGAVSSNLYALKWDTDDLGTLNQSTGAFTMIGDTGVVGLLVAGAGAWGMDASRANFTYAIGNVGGPTPNQMYSVNTTTGAHTLRGPVGTGLVQMDNFTTRNNIVQVLTPTATALEGTSAPILLERDTVGYNQKVAWTATAGSATGGDYVASGVVDMPVLGSETVVANIPIADDAQFEGAETFTVTFGPSLDPVGVNAVIQMTAARTATITIADNDGIATPGPTPDTTKPFAYLNQPGALKRAAFLKSGVLTTTFVSEAVTGTATLRLGTKVIGTAALSSKAGALVAKRVTLSKAGKVLVAKAKGVGKTKRLTYTVTIAVKDAAGNAATVKRTGVLVR